MKTVVMKIIEARVDSADVDGTIEGLTESILNEFLSPHREYSVSLARSGDEIKGGFPNEKAAYDWLGENEMALHRQLVESWQGGGNLPELASGVVVEPNEPQTFADYLHEVLEHAFHELKIDAPFDSLAPQYDTEGDKLNKILGGWVNALPASDVAESVYGLEVISA